MGLSFVILAAICWGLSGGIAGILIEEGWNPFVISFYRGAIGLLLVAVWLAIRPGNSGLANARMWFWSAIAGLGVAGNFSFYFVSISEGSVAVAATLMYCAPIFVFLVSFALRLERSTPLKWIAIVVVMIGVVLLTRIYDTDTGSFTIVGLGTGLLSGLSFTVFIFGFKYAAKYGSPQAILTIALSVLVVVLFWPAENHQMVAVLDSSRWPLFAILGVIGAGPSFILYIIGLKQTAPTVAAMVAMVEPVTASLFAYLVLDQSMIETQILGMAVILITVAALGWRRSESA